ncbi:hypothetical protein [Flavobacterium sp.]|jgi:hypothetical protein|uniref:hypothetical protein n=1 Tax=Flavobacterium sp. TaxID=239 RepID=UPI0037C19B4B
MSADKQILSKLEKCADTNDLQGFSSCIDELLLVTDVTNASLLLSAFLLNRHTTSNSNATAKLLEIILNSNDDLAMINFPDNCFFQTAVLKGSIELYECYMEEAIESYLYDKTEDEAYTCYMNLNTIAERYNDLIFDRIPKYIKGKDFKSAISKHEKDPNLVLIDEDDVAIMEKVIENYNGILGRRDILKDLEARMVS